MMSNVADTEALKKANDAEGLKERIAAAQDMRLNGSDPLFIARLTGLSLEQVKKMPAANTNQN